MMGKFRPQIMAAIVLGTVFGGFGMWVGLQMDAIEIVTAIIGSVFGFLGGVSLKVLESADG